MVESDRSFRSTGILNEKQSKILRYIDTKIDNFGYIKSKEVSEHTEGVSSKEVGSNMHIISRECDLFEISEWSTSASNTWMIERRED